MVGEQVALNMPDGAAIDFDDNALHWLAPIDARSVLP
jgi:hypothetical protein